MSEDPRLALARVESDGGGPSAKTLEIERDAAALGLGALVAQARSAPRSN